MDEDTLSYFRGSRLWFVFQSYNLLARTSALKNVTLPLLYNTNGNKGTSASEREALAMEALEMVGLGDRVHHRPNELSGGQQQRVAIARALVNDPQLLFADEPTGNLDSKTGDQIMEVFHELHRQGVTVILVTHEPSIAAQARRMIRLLDGKIVEDRPVKKSEQPVAV